MEHFWSTCSLFQLKIIIFCSANFSLIDLASCTPLLGLPCGSEVTASAWTAGDPGSIPESERSPGEGNGNPLQYSCLENPVEGGAWWATVHGISKSQTRLNDFTFTYSVNKYIKKVMLMLDIIFLVKKYNLFINSSIMYSAILCVESF